MIKQSWLLKKENRSEEYDSRSSSLRKESVVFEIGKPGLGKCLQLLFEFGHQMHVLSSLLILIHLLTDSQIVIPEGDCSAAAPSGWLRNRKLHSRIPHEIAVLMPIVTR